MKTVKSIFSILLLGSMIAFQSCQKDIDEPTENKESILPERFGIDIPGSMSKQGSANKAAQTDTMSGNEIYEHLTTFIGVGEGAADIVGDIIWAIDEHEINQAMSMSFDGDDGRVKNLTVVETASYEGINYEFKLTITDAASEGEADGGNAMQVFWNRSPIEGVAILKPYNIDRVHDRELLDAVFRIAYSEVATADYDAHMVVEIADLPMPDPRLDPYALNSLKMYVGKKGEQVDVYGNSDHPNAYFYTENTGFSWSFVASSNNADNIAVAEVGLPPSSLDEADRDVLLVNYSIKNVLTDEINQWFLNAYSIRPDSSDLARYLQNADAPGFFDENGFLQGGTAPSTEYDALLNNIQALAPFNPKVVSEQEILFQ